MKVRFAFLVLVLFLWAAPAFSQGCAMCYSSAVSASNDGQRSISRGVIVLVLPPAGFLTLGGSLAYVSREKRDPENSYATYYSHFYHIIHPLLVANRHSSSTL